MRNKSATLVAFVFLASIILQMITPVPASAATSSSGIVISELSMGSTTSATDEFVELYNNSSNSVNMSGWSLYYRSATGTSYSKRATFSTSSSIASHTFFLISTATPNDLTLISGMAQTGGVIELRDSTGAVVDRVGYGNSTLSSGKPAITVEAGQSMYRQFDFGTNTMVNTSDNFSDFYTAITPTPKDFPVVEAEEVDTVIVFPTITINELFPNPPSEQSETSDEFIELYNPNNVSVDLTGWQMKDASGHVFKIIGKSIPSGGYLELYSSETHLALNNTGDTITLVNPNNDTVDVSTDYGSAKDGISWGLVNGEWAWNATPTPGNTNSTAYVEIITTKPIATSKKTTIKQATTKKVAAAKKVAAKKPKASKLASSKSSASNSSPSNDTPTNLQSKFANFWPWLLIVLGTATIGYGIYEYRPEITTAYHQLKHKLGAGR